jgi:hypothetical protein
MGQPPWVTHEKPVLPKRRDGLGAWSNAVLYIGTLVVEKRVRAEAVIRLLADCDVAAACAGPLAFDMVGTTILMVKERVVAEWPETAEGDTPSGATDLKLILSGQILDNAKTLAGTCSSTLRVVSPHTAHVTGRGPPRVCADSPLAPLLVMEGVWERLE